MKRKDQNKMEPEEGIKIILFDVNETLLDMSKLKQGVNGLFDNPLGFRVWFGLLLQYSLVDSLTTYHNFTEIADATLQMAGAYFEKSTGEEERNQVLSVIKELPPHPEVYEALELLKKAGYRLATLTNSPMATLSAQLKYAQIDRYFEAALSIDSVKKYKPAVQTYQYAAQKLDTPLSEIMMVAAHAWDVSGAMYAGMKTAFIERPGQSIYPLTAKPDFSGKDLLEIARLVISSGQINRG